MNRAGRVRYLRLLGPLIRWVRVQAIGAAVAAGDLAPTGKVLPVSRASWAPGISVLIPERGTPELLERALDHLRAALAGIDEPTEIIVVVNGAPAGLYADLVRRFPDAVWHMEPAPLGFSGALAVGLSLARFGGVYLHNSDMAIEADALTSLLPYRRPWVFAIASQIFFDDPRKRREETGWGDMRVHEERPQPFNRLPDSDGLVRSGLYAAGGSSLFDTDLLRRFSGNTSGYAPFYWEDTDWGAQAWRSGLAVLFHPGSVAWHRHRATVSRYYAPEEIDRVVARNAILFALRNHRRTLVAQYDARYKDWRALKDLANPRRLAEVARVRRNARRAPFPDLDLARTTHRIYSPPKSPDNRPLVLVLTPFQILPPRHGGAWRTWRLCQALSDRWRFILLSDEAVGHDPASWKFIEPFESVHLVSGRPDGAADRIGRIHSHSHARLQAELDYLTAVYAPDIIQLEHIELSALRTPAGYPSLLTAHDVLLAKNGREDAADRFERERLAAFDAVVVCSDEDAALLSSSSVAVVPNGAVVQQPWRPSAGNRDLLFAGPFRYPPNLSGLRRFLISVFPELRARFPGIRLIVLCGETALAEEDPVLRQDGVELVGWVDDMRPWFDRCAMTINPLSDIRGSSIKLIESLAAGRVCVSTRDGARGFLDAELPGLIVVDDIPAMAEPIARLLQNETARLKLEEPESGRLRGFSWDSAAEKQQALYRHLLEKPRVAA